MEYAGGTYISQINANSPKAASLKWAQKIDTTQISRFGEKAKQSLILQIKEDIPSQLKGILNGWCVTAQLSGGLALINLIKTENDKKIAEQKNRGDR